MYQESRAHTPTSSSSSIAGRMRNGRRTRPGGRAREDYEWVVYGDVDEHGDSRSWDVDVHVEGHEVEPARSRRRRRWKRKTGARGTTTSRVAFSVDSDDGEGAARRSVLLQRDCGDFLTAG